MSNCCYYYTHSGQLENRVCSKNNISSYFRDLHTDAFGQSEEEACKFSAAVGMERSALLLPRNMFKQ